jgi:hypothetical protein
VSHQRMIRPVATEADRQVYRTRNHLSALIRCGRCHELKPLTALAVDRSRPCGRRTVCADCRAAYDRHRRTAKPHIGWESDYRARCRRYGLIPAIVSFTREQLVDCSGDSCVDCGGAWDQIDHRIPVAEGGRHDLQNCRPICAGCNGRKRWVRDRASIRAFRLAQPRVRAVAS